MPGKNRQDRAAATGAERTALAALQSLLASMRRRYDHGHWWPARTRFEMMAGSILTQRTRWDTAAAAISRLKRRRLLQHDRLAAVATRRIATVVRPCGDHRVKARRLAALARHLAAHGGPAGLARMPTTHLRESLLAVHGIGPETADAILLYAYGRAVFVADAYALRFLRRVGWLRRQGLPARYGPVHDRVTRLMAGRTRDLADLHAVIVEHGKHLCGARPRCGACFLARRCATGRRITGSRTRGR